MYLSQQFLEPMKQIAEKVKSKNPQETRIESAVQDMSAAFYEFKDWVQTVVNKINLDAQNEAKSTTHVQAEDSSDEGIDILKGLGQIIKGIFQAVTEDHTPPAKVSANQKR